MTDISIVIPLFNEDESLGELHQWIRKVMNTNNFSYEVIYIDDGSNDKSWDVLQNLKKEDGNVKAVRFQRNYGKSAALHVGFDMAVGEVVVTMDADLQDSPEEIPDLRKMILVDGFDLVSGWKKKRYDPISKTIPTKLFNWTTRKMSGIYLHDFNCGLKIYRKNVVKSLEIFGEMHRYIPVMAHKEGFRKIGEKVVEHRARKYGVSKFGLERFINGFLDLLTITFISRFGKKPMHFFGSIGLLMFIIGFSAFTYIGGSKLWALFNDEYQKNIADQSIFYIALTSMIIGTQLFMAGFVGELITRNSSRRNDYKITEVI
ncbi:MAG: Undecaprenyl-phosphate 4-deoxy-4-formamido-L-arabinose transferase [Bacteroidota bacterium]|jgi:glycosyltransferase involved in cell wall biosynthesis